MTCAVDIDVREFTITRDSTDKTITTDDMQKAVNFAFADGGPILVEVASPVFYHGDSKAASASTARWMIYNSIAAGVFSTVLAQADRCVLVSPSSKWTMGYDEKTRHELAGFKPLKYRKCKGKSIPLYQHNHDIRECYAMLWSYKVKPSLWVPVFKYLESL